MRDWCWRTRRTRDLGDPHRGGRRVARRGGGADRRRSPDRRQRPRASVRAAGRDGGRLRRPAARVGGGRDRGDRAGWRRPCRGGTRPARGGPRSRGGGRARLASARVHERSDGEGSELGDAHATVAAGGIDESEELSENVLDTARLEHGDVDAVLSSSHVVVQGRFPHTVDVSGVHRAADRDRMARARRRAGDLERDAGPVGDPRFARKAVRPAKRPDQGEEHPTGWGIRREDDDRRAARRLGGAGAPPTRPPGDDSQRGHRSDESRRRGGDVARAWRRRRRRAHGDPRAHAGGPRKHRRVRRRVDRGDAQRRPLSLGRAPADRRSASQPTASRSAPIVRPPPRPLLSLSSR